MGVADRDPLAQLSLPPGFRFYPTDEELLVQYLCRKVAGHHFSLPIIAEIDLYKFDPWDLPGKAVFGEKEWYFFSPRDRKYPNGSRPNRVAGSGYWKATGTDKVITTQGRKVGIKKSLVFYIGKAPKGTKTNWIMHEFRLTNSPCKGGSLKLDDWVLCRIYKRTSGVEKSAASAASREHSAAAGSPSSSTSQLDDVIDSFPEINDGVFALPRMNSLKSNDHRRQGDTKLGLESSGPGSFDWSVLAGLTVGPEFEGVGPNLAQFQQLGGHVMNYGGEMRVPSLPPLCHVESPEAHLGGRVEEEVQSGMKKERATVSAGEYLGWGPNSMWAQSYPNSNDPFGIRYADPNPGAGFGFSG